MLNNKQVYLIKIILCIICLTAVCGCWNIRELNELEICDGISVDKIPETKNILLTAQIIKASEVNKSSSQNGEGGISSAFFNVSGTGKSIFEAIRNTAQKTGYRIYASHSKVIIFGKKIATTGLNRYYDFFLRAHEIRPDTLILISTKSASKILYYIPKSEKLTGMYLATLINGYTLNSKYRKIRLQDFSNAMMSKTTAPVAPLVGMSYTKGVKNLSISGMAVFKKGKMIGTLTLKEGRGLLWVNGEVKSGAIEVPTPSRTGIATLEIVSSSVNATPEIKNGKVIFHIKIKENSSLVEQSNSEDLFKFTTLQKLAKSQGIAIRNEIMRTFKKSKKLNADIFGFGEKIHKKYPSKWKMYSKNWDKIYPSIRLDIKVNTKIIKTENITKPAFLQ